MPQFTTPPPEQFSQPSHVVVLGKEAHDPTDKVQTTSEVPTTADRLISVWLINHTGHELTLLQCDRADGSVWAKEPPKTIPNGHAARFQVDSDGPGHGATAYVLYEFDRGLIGGRPGNVYYYFDNPWHGPNKYSTEISAGYAMKQTGGGGAHAYVNMECSVLFQKQADEA